MMKRTILLLAFCSLLTALPAAGQVNVNVNLGVPVPVPIIVPEPPLFLVPPSLGVQAAVGVDFDLFRVDNRYYQCRDNVWYVGPRYNGPWTVIVRDRLPPGLRKHKLEKIRAWRDAEYRDYRRDEKRYRGRAYRPDHEHNEDRDHDHQGRGKGHGKGKHKND